jgi:signal peptidase I
MEPLLRDGDRILVEPAARLRAGDVVVFQGRREVLTAHRLLGCTITPRGLRWMTRPDAAGPIDGLLRRDQILGKVVRNVSQQHEIVPGPWFRAQSAARLVAHTLRLASRKLARGVSGAVA